MPFPGSQEINSLDSAYLIYSYRWYFRIVFWSMILTALINVLKNGKKWIPLRVYAVPEEYMSP